MNYPPRDNCQVCWQPFREGEPLQKDDLNVLRWEQWHRHAEVEQCVSRIGELLAKQAEVSAT